MIVTLIVIALALIWLGVETKWLTIRLAYSADDGKYLIPLNRTIASLASWEYSPLCLLVLILLVLHFNAIGQIKDPVFDERYYISAARSILAGNGSDIIGHPPLGQLLISSGMLIFGDNPLGWRFFSVIFGILSIVLLYLICRELKISRNVSFLATFIFSIGSLGFFLSTLAMLDVFSVTFMLAAFWAYLKKWHVRTGLFVGLAALAKLSGALALLVILLHWFFVNRDNKRQILIIGSVSVASFLMLLPLFDLAIWHRWLNPFEQVRNMLRYTQSITFARYIEAPFGATPSRPWDWLINLSRMEWLAFDGIKHQWYAQYYLMISPSIWVFIIPSMLFMLYKAIKRSSVAIFTICWFAGSYLIWIPASLITDRLSYVFYFYPTLGAVCIGISLGLDHIQNINLKNKRLEPGLRWIIPLYLLISLIFFIALCPGSIWFKIVCGIILYAAARYYTGKRDELTAAT
jgi:dolichyl-phosphate-mannose-protein mannosyltransferase